MAFRSRCILLFLVATFFCLSATALKTTPTITIPQGSLFGAQDEYANMYFGIPYAEPPTGNLRWAEPKPAGSWNSTLNATEFGAGCPQRCDLPPLTCPSYTDEGCLNLNIFTPLNASNTSNLPVMVFLPGGRFEQGGAGTPVYLAQEFVKKGDVILVTVNYRLGVLGWLANSQFSNLGLHDQRVALRWVQDNIQNFGGSPNNVTLFGQSAGATSTSVHLISPNSTGLFHRAIIESNPWTISLKDMEQASQLSKLVIEGLGCKYSSTDIDMDCLRKVSVSEILDVQTEVQDKLLHPLKPLGFFMPWVPIVNPPEVPDDVFKLMASGDYANNDIPLMMGSVANETLIFIWEASPKPIESARYDLIMTDIFKDDVFDVLKYYSVPQISEADTRPVMSVLGTDFLFTCAQRNVATGTSKVTPSYVYFFEHVVSFSKAWGKNFSFCYNYTCHASELPFVFDSATVANSSYVYTEAEEVLIRLMITHWTNFAKTGNPNLGRTPAVEFPLFDASKDILMHYMSNSSTIQNLRAEQCAMFDKIGYNHGE